MGFCFGGAEPHGVLQLNIVFFTQFKMSSLPKLDTKRSSEAMQAVERSVDDGIFFKISNEYFKQLKDSKKKYKKFLSDQKMQNSKLPNKWPSLQTQLVRVGASIPLPINPKDDHIYNSIIDMILHGDNLFIVEISNIYYTIPIEEYITKIPIKYYPLIIGSIKQSE
jgi:hypothetical protein